MDVQTLDVLRHLARDLRVVAGTPLATITALDPAHTAHFHNENDADAALAAGVQLLAHYQARLAAQDTYGLLVVLQAMDAAGKDGAIKHVMTGVNPQGVVVHSLKAPSTEELDHDFLWRYTLRLPSRGQIGIFNRSHYEEVLVVRVHPELLDPQHLPPDARGNDIWKRRYDEINNWERTLVDNGIRIVKIWLKISKAEQRRRFLARLDDPDRNWKFSPADLAERQHWDAYQKAYADTITHTSTHRAPWHVVPADHKWFARTAVAAVVVDALADIDPQFPKLSGAIARDLDQARSLLQQDHD